MPKKRVKQKQDLIVLHLIPKFNRGGAEGVIANFASGKQDEHINGYVACSGGDWTGHLENLGVKWFMIPSLYPSTPANAIRSFFILLLIVKRNNIDIIHSHHRFCSLVGRTVCFFSRTAFICTVHDMASGNPLISSWAMGSSITVFSNAVASHLVNELDAKSSHVCKIPIGIRAPAPLTDEYISEVKGQLDCPQGHSLIGFIGRLASEKAPDIFLRAIPEILQYYTDTCFFIVGSGDMRKELESLAVTLKIEKAIRFLGDRDDVFTLISCLDFVVVPSLREGFGLVALESLSLGKPVIASYVGGLPEIISHEKNGLLVPPGQHKAIAEAAKRLLGSPTLTEKMGRKAREMTRNQYSISSMKKSMNIKYRDVLRKHTYGNPFGKFGTNTHL